ncbi:MAG: twitching motility protein PilT [Bacteroidetes bacterium 4572_128]|nr:MAG: twitching motility protein PilT [Bacteroidetes bacterium 4572_128]
MKKYLLDTHTFIWTVIDDNDKLSRKAKNIIRDVDNELFISTISFWEIAIKKNIGKLELNVDFDELIKQLKINKINLLNINLKHIKQIINMPLHHRDPFDRMLISQAKIENMVIITRDKHFHKYDINILW